MLGRRGDRHLWIETPVILLSCAITALMIAPQDEPTKNCWFTPPGEGRYREQPEEQAVVLDTLLQHFKRHPAPASERLCIATPGHKALSARERRRLEAAGVRVDARENCHFFEEQQVWSVNGAWRVDKDTFVTHVTKIEFGHLSLWLAGYEYRLTKKGEAWVVIGETASPCNPKIEPPKAGKAP